MRKILSAIAVFVLSLAVPARADVPKPPALVADGIPPVPDEIAIQSRPYMEFRTARMLDWDPLGRTMLIATRFGNVAQLHTLAGPLMARRQITFESEPVSGFYAPNDGTLVVSKDIGGNENYQLYTMRSGRLSLLTDGKSRNQASAFSRDGAWLGYSSNRRNGTDADLYIVDPRNPATTRMVAEVQGGGWAIADFAPDNRGALVTNYVSVTKTDLYWLDFATGAMQPIGDHRKSIAYGSAELAPDGAIWITSDEGSDFKRLGTLDRSSGKFTPRTPERRWDVNTFDLAPDGRFLAYVVNEAGISKLRLLEPKSGTVREVTGLPRGVIASLRIAPWGAIGLTLTSATVPGDAYSVDPATLEVTRWTESETGGLDPALNRDAELIEVGSFDREPVSGFLYRPDPARFPGKRPLIVNIHGGPESQSVPSFRGRTNYLLNELGIALFYPNVRGSTGFGKRFVSLDNGPFLRENSVKDIGSFLDRLQADPGIDARSIAVSGGSYGGYMCYASAIRYGARLKAAACSIAISNFVTFLENTQDYRRDLRRVEYGDERVPAQRAKLMAISPLTSAAGLNLPLLVITGANDPRVPQSEADQIVKAVRDRGLSVWHLVGTNEGHGFAKKENADYQFWTELMFYKKNLLGQ